MGMFDSQGGPDFSLAGMILGGRGYAANWFQQRDQMMWAEAAQAKQDALEKQQAADMMAGPQYKAFRDNPMDRAAALDFWAGSRGMAGATDDQAASYVGTSLGAQYTRAQSAVTAQQQKELAAYGHELNLKETDYRGDKELQVYKDKQEYDARRQQLMAEALSKLPGEAAQNMAFDARFPGARKENQSVDFDEATGEIYFKPMTNSPDHVKMMSQLTSAQTLTDKLSEMTTQMDSGDYTTESWNSTVANLSMTAKSLFEAGSLDQGLLDVINNIIPKVSRLDDPGARGRNLETLRASIEMMKIRTKDVLDTYSYRIGDLPKERQDKKYFPDPVGKPPKQGSVTAAQKQIETQPAVPPPDYGKQYDPASPGGVFQ